MNIRIFDNGGATCDRYSVMFLDTETDATPNICCALLMSENAHMPNGVCMWADADLLSHEVDEAYTEIALSDLAPRLQQIIIDRYNDLNSL